MVWGLGCLGLVFTGFEFRMQDQAFSLRLRPRTTSRSAPRQPRRRGSPAFQLSQKFLSTYIVECRVSIVEITMMV